MCSLTSTRTGGSLWALLLCFLLILPWSSIYLWASSEQRTLSEAQRIIHVLNRLGFGPGPGDIEKVKAVGIEAYIEQQLHPTSIPDFVVEGKLAKFKTLTMTTGELAEMYPTRQQPRRQRPSDQRKSGKQGEMQKETSPDRAMREPSMEPSMGTDTEAADTEAAKKMQEARRKAQMALRQIQIELSLAKLLRAVYSERQLQEVMVDFWMNHFNVFIAKGLNRIFTTDFEQNVIRPRALGKFEDLLIATAKSPAMLFYLDNWVSSAPAEVMEKRVSALRKRLAARFRDMQRRRQGAARPRRGGSRPEGERGGRVLNEEQRRMREMMLALRRAKGLNENYGRELMELHTLGVDGGYSQEDVIQVAKCLTGWTITRPRQRGAFRFEPLLHEKGDKVVLGQTIKAAGIEEGEQVIRILAQHPATARFISTKLVRRFVADDPPEDLVNAASRTFERTGGDIREVLRTIFTHPQFFSEQIYQAKVKKPLELVVSSLRAVGAEVEPERYLLRALTEMGEALYLCLEPTGYPDVASAWINTNSLLKRLNFAIALAANRIPRVQTDLEAAQPLFQKLGLPEPDPGQGEQTRLLLSKANRQDARPAGVKRTPITKQVIAAAFMLGSPQFQKR
ncbi:DUF1800 domain-containing protein [Acidobacteria bacterium AH-259-L09]|nr:DUF1800 domain-containing protein [Acidobacteria bacterium AH-259-L09]